MHPPREHKARQEEAKAVAGDAWQECDVVFARPDGLPLDPRADWEEFKELLEEASIRDWRPHDRSRHTAGTFLPAPEPTEEPATETRTETTDSRAARARRRHRIR